MHNTLHNNMTYNSKKTGKNLNVHQEDTGKMNFGINTRTYYTAVKTDTAEQSPSTWMSLTNTESYRRTYAK